MNALWIFCLFLNIGAVFMGGSPLLRQIFDKSTAKKEYEKNGNKLRTRGAAKYPKNAEASNRSSSELTKFGKEIEFTPILLDFLRSEMHDRHYKLDGESRIIIEDDEYKVTAIKHSGDKVPPKIEKLPLKEAFGMVMAKKMDKFGEEHPKVVEYFKRTFREVRLVKILKEHLIERYPKWIPKEDEIIKGEGDGNYRIKYAWTPAGSAGTELREVYGMIREEERGKIEKNKDNRKILQFFHLIPAEKDGRSFSAKNLPIADRHSQESSRKGPVKSTMQRSQSVGNFKNAQGGLRKNAISYPPGPGVVVPRTTGPVLLNNLMEWKF